MIMCGLKKKERSNCILVIVYICLVKMMIPILLQKVLVFCWMLENYRWKAITLFFA